MTVLYSQIEREMHIAIVSGEKLSAIEKQLQSRYQVDSTTIRNVYHNLKGKHQGVKELRKNQVKDLKSTIKSIQSAIKKRLKKKIVTAKDRFVIHQKKRKLAIKQHKLQVLEKKGISLCFGTKKLFLAQYHLEENGYRNHKEWLKDWKKKRSGRFYCIGKSIEGVSISTTGKRLTAPIRASNYHRGKLKKQKPTSAQVCLHRDGNWYVHIQLKSEAPKNQKTSNVIGVDFGRRDIAVTSTGKSWLGKEIQETRDKFSRVRGSLQKKASQGTRSTSC